MNITDYENGTCFDAWEYFGAHLTGYGGTIFRTYAPHAKEISLIGSFNNWHGTPMQNTGNGCWECYVKDAHVDDMYKYRITSSRSTYDHADPYGFASRLRPERASVISDSHYVFTDAQWMANRKFDKKPLNIYEMHFGSWRKMRWEWYRYEEMAHLLIPYLRENGFNAVEFLPLTEYPMDESWGYQATGYFCPTSRYGDADGLKYLIDQLHQSGIAVIMDMVFVHFAVDHFALRYYDGTSLYDRPGHAGESEWGSRLFAHEKGHVQSFLKSCCTYWLKQFHVDGLRYDAAGNLIYNNGKMEDGEYEAGIAFLKSLNHGLKERFGNIFLVAEDPTLYQGVTKSTEHSGAGFDFKWDFGWIHDVFHYMCSSESERKEHPERLANRMNYCYSEKFMMAVSHDEVTHGKKRPYEKLNGAESEKYDLLRALYAWMYCIPGKKLDFMGDEFAADEEWDVRHELNWNLFNDPAHAGFQHFHKDLCHLYLDHPALFEKDDEPDGFAWENSGNGKDGIFSFRRFSSREVLYCLFNYSDHPCQYEVHNDRYHFLLLSTAAPYYGRKDDPDQNDFGHSHILYLPPRSAKIYLEQ